MRNWRIPAITPPGATERHGEFDGLAAEFIDVVSFTRPKPGSPVKGMFHLITNVLTDFADADHAFAESYHVARVQMTDGNDAAIGGRYFDRFERRNRPLGHRASGRDLRLEPHGAGDRQVLG